MMSPPPTAAAAAAGADDVCKGANCSARDPFPLHRAHDHVTRTFLRLCSSCLLKIHAASFCSSCLDLVVDANHQNPPTLLVRCSKCTSVAHLACIPNPGEQTPEFLCPRCSSGNLDSFSYFSVKENEVVDVWSAKVFLTASKVALSWMRKRAVAVGNEVNRKVKESAVARKRARHLLMNAKVVCENEEEDEEDEEEEEEEEPKRKEVKRVGSSREIEKWMRFHEPIPIVRFVDSKSRVGAVGRKANGLSNQTQNGGGGRKN